MRDNKLVITIEQKTIHLDLPKNAGINLKDEIYSTISHNDFSAEHTMKN